MDKKMLGKIEIWSSKLAEDGPSGLENDLKSFTYNYIIEKYIHH